MKNLLPFPGRLLLLLVVALACAAGVAAWPLTEERGGSVRKEAPRCLCRECFCRDCRCAGGVCRECAECPASCCGEDAVRRPARGDARSACGPEPRRYGRRHRGEHRYGERRYRHREVLASCCGVDEEYVPADGCCARPVRYRRAVRGCCGRR